MKNNQSKSRFEVEKYPYCGRIDQTEAYLSDKVGYYTLKVRKNIIKRAKWLIVYGDFVLRLTNGIVPSQAIGLAIPSQTPAIIRFSHSNADLSKQAIIAQSRYDGVTWQNKFEIKLKNKVMQFLKADNVYKIIRITGSQDNILGVTFNDKNKIDNNIEVIEWDFPNIKERRIRTSKKEVLEQVLFGLESVNQSLGTSYKLSKIYFSPFDIPANLVYSGLIAVLIRHYHSGNEFKEV